MLSLNLPSYEIKIAERNGKNVIFDMLRKRYVALTPEEWVRQHFVHYLTDYKGYPKGLLANEIQLDLNGTKKRCDTVLYNKDLSAKLIVEYKAPHIEITQTVFDQITRYNMVLKVPQRKRYCFRRYYLLTVSKCCSAITPANSGSIMMRPQYSHTIIFLRIRISSCFWGGILLKQPPHASR